MVILSLSIVSTLTVYLLMLSSNLPSYVAEWNESVSLSSYCSALPPLNLGVSQGSVLCTMLLSMFIKPLSTIIDLHSIMHH